MLSEEEGIHSRLNLVWISRFRVLVSFTTWALGAGRVDLPPEGLTNGMLRTLLIIENGVWPECTFFAREASLLE